MADALQFSLTGLDSLLGKLESVQSDVKLRGGRFALRRAAQVVEANARDGARNLDDEATGRSIAGNVALRWNGQLFRRTGDLGFRVGVLKGAVLARGGELSSGSPTPHWRLLEFGTEKMRAQPFMRTALSESIAAVTSTFLTEYEKAIDRAIRRAARQSARGQS